jgi:hypothetical protein
MDYKPENYPSEFKNFREVHGYGGVRIYRVSKAEADKIAKEFPSSFRFKPAFREAEDSDQLYYMNVSHGEQHFIFPLPKSS